MSAKVKKRFEEMQAYLGRDTEGLKKLKLLKDDVNELRTSLAAAKEQLEQMAAIKDAARERADVAEAELARVKLEQSRIDQKMQGLVKRAEAAEVAIKKLSDTDDDEVDAVDDAQSTETTPVNIQAIYATLRKLRKTMPRRPLEARSVHVAGVVTQVPLYRLDSVLEEWTHNRIWSLGAFVAIQSQIDNAVVIMGDSENTVLKYMQQHPESKLGEVMDMWIAESVDNKTMNMANRSLLVGAAKKLLYDR